MVLQSNQKNIVKKGMSIHKDEENAMETRNNNNGTSNIKVPAFQQCAPLVKAMTT